MTAGSSLWRLPTWGPYQTAHWSAAQDNHKFVMGCVYFPPFLENYCLSLNPSEKGTRLISNSFCYSPPRSLCVFLNPEPWQRSESGEWGEGSLVLWGKNSTPAPLCLWPGCQHCAYSHSRAFWINFSIENISTEYLHIMITKNWHCARCWNFNTHNFMQ